MEDRPWEDVLQDCLAIIAQDLEEKEQRLLKQQAEFERNEQYLGSRQSPLAVGYNSQGNKQ